MKFFEDCKTKADAKKRYHDLCKMFHPDKGGNTEYMVKLKEQYDAFEEGGDNTNAYFEEHLLRRGFSNFTSRVRPTPFDHPIHQVVLELREKVRNYETRIMNMSLEISMYRNLEATYKDALEQCEEEKRDLQQQIAHMEEQIKLMSIENKKPKTWWERLWK